MNTIKYKKPKNYKQYYRERIGDNIYFTFYNKREKYKREHIIQTSINNDIFNIDNHAASMFTFYEDRNLFEGEKLEVWGE